MNIRISVKRRGRRLGASLAVSFAALGIVFAQSLADHLAGRLMPSAVKAASATRRMARLKEVGVRIAIDDFGTGYSSLSYLLQLDPKVIKIDQSFISPEKDSVQSEMLLEAIISLGQKLHVTLLAEGIETQRQLKKLLRLGCKFGQGFLFSRAVCANDVAELLI